MIADMFSKRTLDLTNSRGSKGYRAPERHPVDWLLTLTLHVRTFSNALSITLSYTELLLKDRPPYRLPFPRQAF